MRRWSFLLAVALSVFALGACSPKEPPAEEELPDVPIASKNPLLGYWFSPQDSLVSQLYFTEDTLFFTDLLMGYPYFVLGDSLIVNGPDGDAFIRWSYLLRPDTLMLFQRPEGSSEEYVVLMVRRWN